MIQQKSRRRRRRSANAPLLVAIGFLSIVLVAVSAIALTLRPDVPDSTVPSVTQPQGGWKEENGIRFYRNADGSLATGWLTLENGTYYLDGNGAMQTGWLELDGKRYCLAADGILQTGWLITENGNYYLDASGVMQTGWLELNGKRYCLTEEGVALTGWQTLDGQDYYFKSTGAMATGTVEIDGVNHHFTSAGVPIIIANPWNFLPEGYNPELKELPRELGEGHQVVAGECYDRLVEMLRACNAAMKEQYKGTSGKIPQTYVISSYRTHDYQKAAYERKIERVMDEDPTLTREEAAKIAATVVAYPGTSEHQLGYAVDIIDTQLWKLEQEQENLPAQQWLMANSWEYGFILRYPKDKTDSTGIIYEPWHYRYVGLEVAKELHESGLTLEEYLISLS